MKEYLPKNRVQRFLSGDEWELYQDAHTDSIRQEFIKDALESLANNRMVVAAIKKIIDGSYSIGSKIPDKPSWFNRQIKEAK